MKSVITKEVEINLINYLYDVKYELAIKECTLGMGGRYGIVDILSYHGKSIPHGRGKPRTRETTWKCYEIKTSKADFYSKHKWTFVGDYNYFVVPNDLYEIIKDDIPKGIGCLVYTGGPRGFKNVKRASKKKMPMDETQIMHDYLVSNNRDARRWARLTKHK